jgi:hypothetical protein
MKRTPARVFRALSRPLIDTVASARCKKAPEALQPFQRFAQENGKPLKRLQAPVVRMHRAEATVLMRTRQRVCGIQTLALALLALLALCAGLLACGIRVSAS